MVAFLPALGALLAAPAAPAVIGLAGTAIGAAAQSAQVNRQNAHNDPAAIRKRYEAAGFNPLLGVGNGAIPAASAQIGDTIASGLRGVGELLHGDRQLELQAQQLAQDNQRLNEIAKRATIDANIGGIYGNSSSRGSALGPIGSNNHGLGDLVAPSVVDPRRSVKGSPLESIPGLLAVDNAYTGGRVLIPGSDGDPWGFGELVTAGISAAPQIGYNHLKNWLNSDSAKASAQYARELRDQNNSANISRGGSGRW